MAAPITIKGLDEALTRLRAVGRDIDGAVEEGLELAAEQVAKKAVQNIQNMNVSYNGHTYDAKDTGALMASLHEEHSVKHIGKFRWMVGTDVKYAPYVEFGTGDAGDPKVPHSHPPAIRTGKNGEPREIWWSPRPPCPYLIPALEQSRADVVRNIKEAILNAWRNST